MFSKRKPTWQKSLEGVKVGSREENYIPTPPLAQRMRKPLILAGFVALVALLVYVFLFSPLFAVRDFVVTGSKIVSAKDVKKILIAEVEGKNIYLIDTNKLAQTLVQKLNKLQQVKIEKRYPGTLVVSITEEYAALFWESGNMRYVVNFEGVVFAGVPLPKTPLPTTTPTITNTPTITPTRTQTLGPNETPGKKPTPKPTSTPTRTPTKTKTATPTSTVTVDLENPPSQTQTAKPIPTIAKEDLEILKMTLPIVKDKVDLKVEVGQKVASEEFVTFVRRMKELMQLDLKLTAKKFVVEETTFEVKIYTEKPWYIYVDTTRSPEDELTVLRQILKKFGSQIHQYVDIRLERKVFYK